MAKPPRKPSKKKGKRPAKKAGSTSLVSLLQERAYEKLPLVSGSWDFVLAAAVRFLWRVFHRYGVKPAPPVLIALLLATPLCARPAQR